MAVWETPEILSGSSPITVGSTTKKPTKKPELGIYILYQQNVTMEWAFRLRQLELPSYIYSFNKNQPYDTAREACVRGLMEKDVKYIFSLDSDVLPPLNTVPALIQFSEQFKLPVISGLYWAKKRVPTTPVAAAWLKTGENPADGTYTFQNVDVKPHMEKRSIIPVDVCGSGCMLVKTEIFRKLDEKNPDLPFFCWGLGRQKLQLPGGKPIPKVSEDFYFCLRLKQELDILPHIATVVMCDHECQSIKRGTDGEFELSRL